VRYIIWVSTWVVVDWQIRLVEDTQDGSHLSDLIVIQERHDQIRYSEGTVWTSSLLPGAFHQERHKLVHIREENLGGCSVRARASSVPVRPLVC
jgi:hypothetical protein